MKTLAIGCVVLSMLVPAAAFSRGGGMGSHHSGSVTGGAFGTNPAAPGTNSAGTALSSSGTGGGTAQKGAALGTAVLEATEFHTSAAPPHPAKTQ